MKNLNAYWLLLLSISSNLFAAEPAAPIVKSTEISEWGVRIVFDKPMQTWHGKTRIDHIRITPAIDCDWYWDDDSELMCRVPRDSGQVKPYTYYRVEILGGLMSQEGAAIKPAVETVASDKPTLSAYIGRWIDNKPTFELWTDPGVDAAAIQQVVSLTQGEKRIAYRIKVRQDVDEDDERLHYDLEYSPSDVGEGLLSLKIVPGLRSTLGRVPGVQDHEMVLASIEPFRLREIGCSRLSISTEIKEPFEKSGAVLCDPLSTVQLTFSEALDANSLALLEKKLPTGFTLKAEEILPDGSRRRYQEPISAPDARYSIVGSPANARYDLPLSTDTRSITGRLLKNLPALTLFTGDFLPRATLSPRRKILLPGERDETALTTINLDQKRIEFEGLSIGSELEQDRQKIRLKSPLNIVERSPLIGASKAVQENGGLYMAGATPETFKNLRYERLYAPFNALISRKNDQVLVWATEWQSGASIPGAKVEVLMLDEQKRLHLLASGVSDNDGVAVVIADLKEGINPQWQSLVRVSKNERTLVQELSEAYDSKLDFKMRNWGPNEWKPSSKKQRVVFGVTELPLYRPGETVKYRIWLRERDGNRLRLPVLGKTLKTELYDSDNSQRLQSWDGNYDASGSHSGEIRLSNLLDDGRYCVRAAGRENGSYEEELELGACFEIARFEAQPLWAELKSDKDTLLLGQKMNLTLESGYFSGGPAADIALVYSGLASSQRFEEAYPAFSGYAFVGSGRWDGDDGENPFRNRKTPTKTDAKGKARYVFAYDSPQKESGDDTIAFGNFEINAEVRIPGKAASSSNTLKTRFSQFERYTGLKTRGWWLSLNEEPGLEAVVVDYRGNAVMDVPVKVSVFQVEGKVETAVGECTILSGRKTPCGVKPAKSGRYLFKASSENAAATELSRYAGSRLVSDNNDDKPVVELQLIKASNGVLPAEVRLIQPYAAANVLFTMEYDKVMHHWVKRIAGNDTILSIPVKAEWAPGVTLRAVVRPADLANAKEAGDIDTLDAALKLDIPRAGIDDIKIGTNRSAYKPGEVVALTLRNGSSQTRQATISVLDDSVYQQATYIWPWQSPDGDNFLGKLNEWSNPAWYGLDQWPRSSLPDVVEIDSVIVVGSKIKRMVEEEGAQPVQVLTRADIERTGLNNVFEILNTLKKSDGSGLSTVSTANNGEEPKELDMVSVSGSKVMAADVFERTQAINRQLKRQDNRNGKRLPHVRGRFQDAVYWNPDLVLAPGETKTVSIKLPDNLTRWRVLVWTSDDSDGFAQHQASFETSLPIEVRTGVPGQLFVGDQASAQITARNQQQKNVTMTLTSVMSGAGVELSKASEEKVLAYASMSQSLMFSPRSEGPLDLLSIADTNKNSDGVSTSVDVQSRMGTEVLPQSGWLDEEMLRLTIPKLNISAIRPELELTVHRGFHDWTEGWLKDLRDYPHRCWEQTISRAIGAAYSERYEPATAWPDRSVVITDAIQAAPSFQDSDGYFRYFRTERSLYNDEPDYVLTAYTIKAFDYLKSLSVETPDDIRDELEGKMAKAFTTATTLDVDGRPSIPYETAATIAGALTDVKSLNENTLNVLWNQWNELSWYARSELLLAMSRKPEFAPQLQEGIARLQQAGTQHGLRRVLQDDRDFSAYMGSGLRDQCAVTAALWQLDKSETGLPLRKAMLRGVYDLYAGGTSSLDTQSSAQCLMNLHTVTAAMPERDVDLMINAELGKAMHELSLPTKQSQAGFRQALDATTKTLNVASSDAKDGSLHYNATIRYQYDLRNAEAKGTGISLHRNYDVLRNGNWITIGKPTVSEGDWIRVRLLVSVPKERHFVAVTDTVPGGLVTRDIGLSSVGGAQLQKIGGDGSYYFDSRQTGSSAVRIYAEYLPAGQHEIYYYAQAVHPGDYFAPPAVAELMYGRDSRANTSADRVTVQASK